MIDRPLRIPADHPAAPAVQRAESHYERQDSAACDDAWAEAVRLADPPLRSELATRHVARLINLRDYPRAKGRCDAYLEGGESRNLPMHVMRAEILAEVGDHSGVARVALAIRALARPLSQEDDARLHGLQGWAAMRSGDPGTAALHLDTARKLFEELGDAAAVRAVDVDLLHLEAANGDPDALTRLASEDRADTVAEQYQRGYALKRLLRYEEALTVFMACAAREDLLPAMRWPVLREVVLLGRATGQTAIVERIRDLLPQAAADASDRERAEAELTGILDPGNAPEGEAFMARISRALHLLAADAELAEAEEVIKELRDRASTDAETAVWHLAAGNLELKLRRLEDAIAHLKLSIRHTHATWLLEVRVQALRLLGHAIFGSGDPDAGRHARECWNEARRLDEQVLTRQNSDDIRRGMALTIADEYDEWIEAAAAAREDVQGEATAAVVVAMEAARGASILAEILPGDTGSLRDLPSPSDQAGAWDWVRAFTANLPATQAVWLTHAAPGHVHHAVVGRRFLFHVTVRCDRRNLDRAADALAGCWSNATTLEASRQSGEFDRRLGDVARRLGVDTVVEQLPEHVRRIAIVAGGVLSDIPFGAMTVGDDGPPLGVRFALSDLPCLSALTPLHRRSRRLRGDSRLLLSPQPKELPPAPRVRGTKVAGEALKRRRLVVILNEHATPDVLRAALRLRRHRLVMIYSHGRYDRTSAARSELQLAPEGERGVVRAADLQRMDLGGCGTIVLGACETGMARRIGRDERDGFVRAAFVAGAASAVAARWMAPAVVASDMLDRFETYARHLPRDVALQRAQRDIYEGASTAADPAMRHPANWACWTLYGDSGFQTKAGPGRRRLRGLITGRRHAGQR